ncbi:MAG: class I SAM-dependent methyltransferase [Thermoproteota archaeon]|nr:class I SAM-dependent methyltransferase [Thermoproteota archaeon]
MPSSQYYHISKIMEMIISVDPKSVLDMGSGFGKFGVLCREYLELWDGRQKYEFNRRIDCVEVFQKYISPLYEYVYDNVYNNNILEVAPKLDIKYDLILLIDVLEHFEKNDGVNLLKTLLANNECILVSTPKKPTAQKDAFDNVYETHRSVWSAEELSSLGNTAFIRDDISLITIISLNKDALRRFKHNRDQLKSRSKLPIKTSLKKIARRVPGLANAYRKIKVN